jgi:hypothetical protein
MGTTNKFSGSLALNDMLKDYMPYKLLSDEIIKRDYFLSTVEKDQKWKGGELQVPFLGANASSLSLGGLTLDSDISDDDFIRGKVSNYAELWGTMQFHQRDLDSMSGGEGAFVDLIGDRIEVFAQTMKEALSGQLLNGAHIDVIKVEGGTNGTVLADGILGVSRPELFQVGQKIEVQQTNADSTSGTVDAGVAYYVIAVNLSASTITIADNRGDASGVNVEDGTPNEIFGSEKIYHPGSLVPGTGAEQNTFTSLPSQLLSAANGGSAALFTRTKATYPHLQAYNTTGASKFSDSTLANKTALKTIFDAQNTIRRLGRGNPNEAIMSYANFAQCVAELENARQYQAEVKSGNAYGWSEIQVSGVKGSLKLVAVPDMSDSNVLILDKSSMKLHSDGFIERRTSPDGKQFFESRVPAGYKYIVDHRFYGDLVVSKPSSNGIIHSCS